ncbi:hypothetical protein SELR_00320 [Selenomonas ruminantium subsp. lactilytica TAM6421]|uniref:Uncharacterized protein n=1 Tax=Selenomonas ruminantium subsp. lactilytica (strain NBRC 103574 / TAM6421) TaxID=927704 RepID=I0GLV3_SELRL|nr:hypothetical protein SELR_00320 [Selenomonas ruminantium subsp. lactilytica TAM6421]
MHANNPILQTQNREISQYYYKVELTDEIGFQFARIFLPEALLPDGWKVKAETWATAKNTASALAGVDLYTQASEVADAYNFATFQNLEEHYKGKSYEEIKQMSFTNKGPTYNADGTRQEVFNMDGEATINNNMRSLMINFKPDFQSENKLTDNWDLDKIDTMTPEDARVVLYDNGIKLTNWRIVDSNGDVLEENEGGVSLWGKFYDKLTNLFGEETAKTLVFSRIGSVINVINPYKVRNLSSLSPAEISYNIYTDEPNELDPLFVRIESEEYNTQSGNKWVTNTVRDISINIKADNTIKSNDKYLYRPMIFVYDGPVGEDEDGDGIGERGVGRKSRTVTLNLEADFRGIIYAPNSPVHVEGNNHKFQGIIIAQSIVDAAGNVITMPEIQSSETDADLQIFYQNSEINLGDAQYDDFGVVRLTKYNNPQKDVFYLKGRASITI